MPEREVDVISALKALTDSGPKLKIEPSQPGSPQAAASVQIPASMASARVVERQVERPAIERSPELFTPPQVPISVGGPLPSSSPPPIDLTKAARICADLARVLDAGDIPALLTRAADVLKAPGMIVWVADQSGQTLYPLLTHGYPAATLMKMGSLSTEADNATAAAWRTGELRAVPATSEAPGALVAPIVTSDGCVGVLAAEVKDGRELRGEVRASGHYLRRPTRHTRDARRCRRRALAGRGSVTHAPAAPGLQSPRSLSRTPKPVLNPVDQIGRSDGRTTGFSCFSSVAVAVPAFFSRT
jgi:hypothetical protein